MRIAILAWGSLIWDPRTLNINGNWDLTGFTLPIEFSRVSSDGRLTLVIDHENGEQVPVFYALSGLEHIDDAINNLWAREGKPKISDIGYVNILTNSIRCQNDDDASKIKQWAIIEKFDGVIWTDLPSNFQQKTLVNFSKENAIRYLENLPGEIKEKEKQYFLETREIIDTPLRREINRIKWLEVR